MNQELNIVEIISKLNETVELLNKKNISSLEKDLILEKIRNLYEVVLFKGPNTTIEKQSSAFMVEEVKTEMIDSSPANETKIEKPVVEENKVEEENIPVDVVIDEIPTDINEEVEEPIQSNTNEEVIVKTDTKKSSKTLADQYRDNSSKTLSDVMFKSQPENDVSSKIQLKPIKNIKTAISINDRIMFTKELFNNNPDLYNEIVDKVNSMSNITDALDYFSGKVNIHMENEPVKKFLEIVHRRFA